MKKNKVQIWVGGEIGFFLSDPLSYLPDPVFSLDPGHLPALLFCLYCHVCGFDQSALPQGSRPTRSLSAVWGHREPATESPVPCLGHNTPACWRGSGFFLCSSSTFHWAVFSHLVRTLTEAHGLLSLPPLECEWEEGVFCFFGSCCIFRSWHHSWHSEHFCSEKCPRWDYSAKMWGR